jgi:hypothetical protein
MSEVDTQPINQQMAQLQVSSASPKQLQQSPMEHDHNAYTSQSDEQTGNNNNNDSNPHGESHGSEGDYSRNNTDGDDSHHHQQHQYQYNNNSSNEEYQSQGNGEDHQGHPDGTNDNGEQDNLEHDDGDYDEADDVEDGDINASDGNYGHHGGHHGRGEHGGHPKEATIPNVLFITRFNPNHVSQGDIEQHFHSYGNLKNIVINDKVAFVEFETEEQAHAAKHGTHYQPGLGSDSLIVDFKKDNKEKVSY